MILAPPAGYGYDNNWVLFGNNGTEAKAQNSNGHVSEEYVAGCSCTHACMTDMVAMHRVQFAAELLDPVSGRVMELWTNTPGLQVCKHAAQYCSLSPCVRRSTQATTSTAASMRQTARPTCSTLVLPWSSSSSPTRPTSPISPLRSSSQGRSVLGFQHVHINSTKPMPGRSTPTRSSIAWGLMGSSANNSFCLTRCKHTADS